MTQTTRVAILNWHGPFSLCGSQGEATDKRLNQIIEAGFLSHGIYMFVGRKLRVPKSGFWSHLLRRKEWRAYKEQSTDALYIGQVDNRSDFVSRFSIHLDPEHFFNAGKNEPERAAKLYYIEENYELDSIWLAIRESFDTINLASNQTDLDAVENLLIHLKDPELNKRDANTPVENRVLINKFDQTLWYSDEVSPWRPDFLPDIIDYDTSAQQGTCTWLDDRAEIVYRRARNVGKGDL